MVDSFRDSYGRDWEMCDTLGEVDTNFVIEQGGLEKQDLIGLLKLFGVDFERMERVTDNWDRRNS